MSHNGSIQGEETAAFYRWVLSNSFQRVYTAFASPFRHSLKYCSSSGGVKPSTSTLDDTRGWSSVDDEFECRYVTDRCIVGFLEACQIDSIFYDRVCR